MGLKVVRRYSLDKNQLSEVRRQLALTDEINRNIVNVGAIALSQGGQGKEPTVDNWARAAYGDMDFQKLIDDPEGPAINVGFNNYSGWLDLDIDAPSETDKQRKLAAQYCRAMFTGMKAASVDMSLSFGRSSIGYPSHAYVRLPEEEAQLLEELLPHSPGAIKLSGERYRVEFRATPVSKKDDVRKAKQTCVPGSILPRPDDIKKPDISCWYEGGVVRKKAPNIIPARASFSQLLTGHAFGLIIHLLDRADVWHEGNRQHSAVVVAGWLARLVLQYEKADASLSYYFPIQSDSHAHALIAAICEYFNDESLRERTRPYDSAKEKLLNNPEAPLPGWPAFGKIIGAQAIAALRSACLPGAGTNALVDMSETYVLNDANSMYIDLKRARRGQNHEFQGSQLKQRHSDETVEISGKNIKIFNVFEACGLRRRIDAIAFLPQFEPLSVLRIKREFGEVKLLNDEELSDDETITVFNSWRGLPTPPVQHKKLEKQVHDDVVQLLGYLTRDNDDQIRFILKWLAWTLKHPDKKQPMSLVFIGGQNIGKSVFGNALMRALFGEYSGKANTLTMKGQFFVAPFINNIVTFVDEAKFTTNEAEENYKLLVRETRISGERKAIDAETYDVYSRVILAANKHLTITTDATPDRATFVCQGYDQLHLGMTIYQWKDWTEQQKPFFTKFIDNLLNREYVEQMVYWIMNREVTYEEVSSIGHSSSLDSRFRRASARGIELVARHVVETMGFEEGPIAQARLTLIIREAEEELGMTKTPIQYVMRLLDEAGIVSPDAEGRLTAAPRADQLSHMAARLGYDVVDQTKLKKKSKF